MVKLFGVPHGSRPTFGSIKAYEIFLKPSKLLVEELLSAPKGVKVGLEYFTPKHEQSLEGMVVNGLKIHLTKSNKFYWNELLSLCKEKQLKVCFLDDYNTFVESIRKGIERVKLQAELEKLKPPSMSLYTQSEKKWAKEYKKYEEIVKKIGVDKFKSQIKELEKRLYEMETEVNYFFIIKREEKILENIIKMRPEYVVVGDGHASSFIYKREELQNKFGLVFEKYVREVPSERINPNQQSYENEAVVDPLPSLEHITTEEIVRRRYFARTKGRILPDKIPDFIGTWDMELPFKGLFEIYICRRFDRFNFFEGIIEDTIGTALCFGELNDESVSFQKAYLKYCLPDLPERRYAKAFDEFSRKPLIIYSGTKKGDEYIGTFCFERDPLTLPQPFSMKRLK